jgi:uncharacterized protein YggU (UPF0235/DUF167 family)
MKLRILCKPYAHEDKIQVWYDLYGQTIYHISVIAAPVDWKANQSCIDLLSTYFDKPKSHFKIIAGASSRHKLFEMQA